MAPWLSTEERGRKSSEEEELGGKKRDLLRLDSKSYSRSKHIMICDAPPYHPCSALVRLYAAMGLHSYNLSKGKNMELSRVLRCTKTKCPPAASTYCIALDAIDPSLGTEVQTFETSVSEESYGKLSFRCSFATPHGETMKSDNVGDAIRRSTDAANECFLRGCMPGMPPLNPFQITNTNPFYLLKESEVEENKWIRMYLDLAFATTSRGTSKDPDLSKLEIVQVAVSVDEESSTSVSDEGPGHGLSFSRATNAVFYIRHNDWSKARVKKKDVDRIAIVRRIFNHRTGCFSLVGRIHSSQTLPKPKIDDGNSSLVALNQTQSSQTVVVPWLSTEEGRVKYMQLLKESEEFCGTSVLLGMVSYSRRRSRSICNAPPYDPCSVLVRLYAIMGLHTYNLLKGKNLELSRVLKYSKTAGSPAASIYSITLDAMDPSLGLVRTFQTRVSEQSYGKLSLRCNFATPHGETKESDDVGDEIRRSGDPLNEYRLTACMPEMPPLNPFQNTNRFYLLKKSEVEENEWIRMYLDLAFATTIRGTTKGPDLSKVEIVQVAVSVEEEESSTSVSVSVSDEGLGHGLSFSRATNAVFYIRHRDWCKARVKKKDVDRIAIVRRICNLRIGCFNLVGQILSSQTIPKPNIDDENPSLVALNQAQSCSQNNNNIGSRKRSGDSLVLPTQGIQKPRRSQGYMC